jgi:hypothetical protein
VVVDGMSADRIEADDGAHQVGHVTKIADGNVDLVTEVRGRLP